MQRTTRRAAIVAGAALLALAAWSGATALADHDDPADYQWDPASVIPITLAGTSASSNGPGVAIAGGVVTINAPGTYQLTGTLTNGRVVVDSAGAGMVRVILNGASITNNTSSALEFADAGEAMVVLADGTANRLTDATTYVYPDPETDEPNAALFSTADLTITGNGSLAVRGNSNDGISSKDGLVINGGTITVDAVDDGIRGKDYLTIKAGNITVTAGGDGLKSDEDVDTGLGRITITNGTVRVTAGDDGIHGEFTVAISGGDITVVNSYEALEARQITIGGGNITLTSRDDAINAAEEGIDEFAVAPNAYIRMTGGTVVVNTGVDGVDSNGSFTITGGTIVVNGPASGSLGEGSIDTNGAMAVSGGTIAAAGINSTTSTPANCSAQGWVLARLGTRQNANTVAHLVSGGNRLMTFRPTTAFQSVLFSSNQITRGQSYDVYLGGSVSGTVVGGLASGGSITGATRSTTVTAGQGTGTFPGNTANMPCPTFGPTPPTTPVTTRPTTPVTTRPVVTTPATTTPAVTTPGGSGRTCAATYTVIGQWTGGFQAEVRITAGSSAITGWRVTWTYANGQTVTQSWGATIAPNGSSITATNVSYNGSVGAGANTTFGFLGNWNGTNSVPAVTCTAS